MLRTGGAIRKRHVTRDGQEGRENFLILEKVQRSGIP